MTEIPVRPACYGQFGRLNCNCGGNIQCAAHRTFWIKAGTVAGLASDALRTAYIEELGARWPASLVRLLRRAAFQLMTAGGI